MAVRGYKMSYLYLACNIFLDFEGELYEQGVGARAFILPAKVPGY